jgi:lambda repressor-like predicted transcriptional regulator
MQDDMPGEPATKTAPDAKQIIADAIRLRVVTVSKDQSQYAAEDVLAGLKKAGYELRKK